MKISGLIEELTEIKDKVGDILVQACVAYSSTVSKPELTLSSDNAILFIVGKE